MNKRRFLICVIAVLICVCTLYAGSFRANRDKGLKIACAYDAAGMLISRASKAYGADIEFNDKEVSFLRFADCCGTQAEFALADGKFDLAIMCPDAAERFLTQQGDKFINMGGIIINSNVLAFKENERILNILNVGYTNGKEVQAEAVLANMGAKIKLIPMTPSALPYALEISEVDGIVLDALDVVKSDARLSFVALPLDRPSNVLLAKKSIINTEEFKRFIVCLDYSATELNGNDLGLELRDYAGIDDSREAVEIWKELKTQYISILSEE